MAMPIPICPRNLRSETLEIGLVRPLPYIQICPPERQCFLDVKCLLCLIVPLVKRLAYKTLLWSTIPPSLSCRLFLLDNSANGLELMQTGFLPKASAQPAPWDWAVVDRLSLPLHPGHVRFQGPRGFLKVEVKSQPLRLKSWLTTAPQPELSGEHLDLE